MALPPAPSLLPGASSALPATCGDRRGKGSENCSQERGVGIWLSGVEMAWRGVCVTRELTLPPVEAISETPRPQQTGEAWAHTPAHLISSAEKLTMVGMKFSLMMMERICFQSVVLSPSSRQMDSSASFTAAGGLAMDRTSTRCCFLMDFTAGHKVRGGEGGQTTAMPRLPAERGVRRTAEATWDGLS